MLSETLDKAVAERILRSFQIEHTIMRSFQIEHTIMRNFQIEHTIMNSDSKPGTIFCQEARFQYLRTPLPPSYRMLAKL